jgi:hypothetical protein
MTALDGLTQVNTIANPTAITLWAYIGSFVVLLALTGIFMLFARYTGRGPFVSLILAFYAGYAVYAAFPYGSLLPTAPVLTAVLVHAALYLFLVFVFYIVLRRIAASDFIHIGAFGLIAMSFFTAAFLIALAYHVFSITQIYSFNSSIAQLFAPARYFFWWFIAPAIALFFLAR